MYKHGVYGFRFLDSMEYSFYQLFAVGYEYVNSRNYQWDGLKRTDGPLILFQYTVSGQGNLHLKGRMHKLTKGSAFMVEIPSDHQYFFDGNQEHWEFYFLLFRPTKLEMEWKLLSEELGFVFSLDEGNAAIKLLKSIYLHAYNNNISDRYMASSLVYQFIMELNRFAFKREQEVEKPDKIRIAIEYVEQNLTTVESVEEIAQVANLSLYYFTRLFKKTMGLTPLQYVTKLRLERAIRLLKETDYNIEVIAVMVGYANASYFIKVFKQWIGYPPGEFRQGENHIPFTEIMFK